MMVQYSIIKIAHGRNVMKCPFTIVLHKVQKNPHDKVSLNKTPCTDGGNLHRAHNISPLFLLRAGYPVPVAAGWVRAQPPRASPPGWTQVTEKPKWEFLLLARCRQFC